MMPCRILPSRDSFLPLLPWNLLLMYWSFGVYEIWELLPTWGPNLSFDWRKLGSFRWEVLVNVWVFFSWFWLSWCTRSSCMVTCLTSFPFFIVACLASLFWWRPLLRAFSITSVIRSFFRLVRRWSTSWIFVSARLSVTNDYLICFSLEFRFECCILTIWSGSVVRWMSPVVNSMISATFKLLDSTF